MIVIARNYGQLGNRLFLYAHLMGAACEYGTSVANPCFAEYAHLFPRTASDLWCRFPATAREANSSSPISSSPISSSPSLRRRQWLSQSVYLGTRALKTVGLSRYPFHVVRLRGETECDLESDAFAKLARQGRAVLVQGWLFRSERLLRKHAVAIREHFQILPEHRDNVDQAISTIRGHGDVVVGVHIRHGDYATHLGGKYFYSVSDYAQAMRSVVGQFPGKRVVFMVCSNAEMKGHEFEGLNVHFGPGHIVEDIYSFAECDLLIGPPSTYTKWASFYGDVPLHVMEDAKQPIDVAACISNNLKNAA